MRIAYHVLSAPAPLGLLFVAATERGLRYLEFMDRRSLKRTIAAHAADDPDATWEPSVGELRPVADQLEQYFCGTVRRLQVALDPVGSEFERKVWRALLDVPYGRTRSYGDVAKAIGEPRAARAVGLASNRNPIAIVVPCHRVIGADGKLVGYSGGLPRKKFLLGLEARFRGMQDLDGDRVIEQLKVTIKRPAKPARPARPAKARRTVAAVATPSVEGARPARPAAVAVAAAAPGRSAKKAAAPPARRRGR